MREMGPVRRDRQEKCQRSWLNCRVNGTSWRPAGPVGNVLLRPTTETVIGSMMTSRPAEDIVRKQIASGWPKQWP